MDDLSDNKPQKLRIFLLYKSLRAHGKDGYGLGYGRAMLCFKELTQTETIPRFFALSKEELNKLELKFNPTTILAWIAKQGRESGQCMMCGRELTDPESIARGIGPVCFGKATKIQEAYHHDHL